MQYNFFLILMVFCVSFANAQEDEPVEPGLSPVTDIPLALATKRGAAIYEKDWYSWHASDEMFSDPNRDLTGLKGWITDVYEGGASTYYIGGEEANYKIMYQVNFDKNNVAKMVEPIEITSEIFNKFTIRQKALYNIGAACSMTLNSVILEEDDKYLVYWLIGTNVHGEIPVGGHYRFTFDKNDLNNFTKERLSKSCLMLNPQRETEEGAEVMGVAFSHVVSENPLETHVFLSYLYGAMAVITGNGNYLIQDGNITKIADRDR